MCFIHCWILFDCLAAALVDHPGVWEKAGHAYLNEVLVSRTGIPAALAIVLADIVRQLLLQVRQLGWNGIWQSMQ
jgi:regulator of sirC expression with transglutaminase-like and TPR domain